MKNMMTIVLLLAGVLLSVAQTYADEKELIGVNSLDSQNKQLNVVQSSTPSNDILTGGVFKRNSVFIDQVGSNNIGDVKITSNDSEVNLVQIGSNNKTFINLRATTIRENVLQLGNDNLFQDFSIHGAQLHTADVLQNGSYNEVISIGRNSISEKIKVTQNGIGKKAFITHN
jgi:hypothetical protein